jgi:hypothetical protein
MSGDLGIFMYQLIESVATSEVQVGLWHGRWDRVPLQNFVCVG